MWRIAWRLTKGYRLRPWRSPYILWRVETYWGLHADRIRPRDLLKFAWRERRDLIRYLRWADRMDARS